MIFAFTYWRSRNIASAMGAHFAFNTLSIAAIASGGCDDTAASVFAMHALGSILPRVFG
jgi:membrane protease YdiL (CAAX protease family)